MLGMVPERLLQLIYLLTFFNNCFTLRVQLCTNYVCQIGLYDSKGIGGTPAGLIMGHTHCKVTDGI